MTTNQKPQPKTPAEQMAEEADILRAASAIMRKYFGGLGGTITDLDRKAQQMDFWAAEADVTGGES